MKKNAKKTTAKAAEKKVATQAKNPLGKTTKMTRTMWFMNFFKTHKGKIPVDEKILAAAIAEFGQGHVGPGTVFTARQMRGWHNTFCRRGERGLTPKDAITETLMAGKAGRAAGAEKRA